MTEPIERSFPLRWKSVLIDYLLRNGERRRMENNNGGITIDAAVRPEAKRQMNAFELQHSLASQGYSPEYIQQVLENAILMGQAGKRK